ncbi:ATP-binding protein [Cellulomonas sp. zg-ZUI222]|uniref:ATP-binding protein n=1 Tax=Cellulomonas wangleii TaxID=2816956 RepID=A0ABX8D443_9CELL|nr:MULTISPECIES: ATP-binding protein [Cellulomonas]MBO0898772.1 ATP-binding protein [Cellulomonas sp. zg-ZUI22]MBO0919634.1 ATP-binding protein [Cellulomonas wangleii]MBO0923940.1 ATP-binding protein [Cellulomonas wangleii]MBO0924222.1 ATP-binding protein [Cellulomonas wangleii]QVI62235.1 ATP-binding protein [Cellulomonas wangleii]
MTDDEQLTSPRIPPPPAGSQFEAEHTPPAALPPDDVLTDPTHGRTLPATRPPEEFVPLRRWVLRSASELRAMRGDLREQLAASAPPPDGGDAAGPDNVVLVASELATNALAHGRPPAQVSLAVDGHAVLIVVSDCDTTHAPFLAQGREPGEGGFGLQIARRLSSSVGWWSDPGGKHVWATFPAEPTT